MRLHDLVKQRHALAKSFSKTFQDRVKDELKHYKADTQTVLDSLNLDLLEAANKRYQFSIPLIFTNHESMMASLFDRVPEILFTQRGDDDAEKERVVKAAYEYLKDKLTLEMFMTDAAWWYLLSGFTSAHVSYNQKTQEVPLVNEETGEQEIGEDGQPLTYTDYVEDDPEVNVGDPMKEYYSPESYWSVDSGKIPYYTLEKNMEPDEVKRLYNKEVEADTTIDQDGMDKSEEAKKDLERVKVMFYYGTLPKSVKGEIKGWRYDNEYVVIFTNKEILLKKEMPLNEKLCRTLKWHGPPTEFYGFGIAKLLTPFQKEKSMRRGQIARYADIAAFPKILMDSTTIYDKKTIRDPRENLVLLYKGEKKPEYLSAPNISDSVVNANNLADSDAQQASGMLDISQGAQNSSTVDTATGQTIFADAAERRMRMAKKKFVFFYKEVVVLLLKLCQQNWSSEKVVDIMGTDGKMERVTIDANSLQGIDFDTDINIDYESVSINKDVLRQQAIDLYNQVKDDPQVDRREVLDYMLREGFRQTDPSKFHKDSMLEPGMQLTDPQSGQQFVVDENGDVVPAEDMAETMEPEAQGADPTVSSAPGVMGGVMQ